MNHKFITETVTAEVTIAAVVPRIPKQNRLDGLTTPPPVKGGTTLDVQPN